MAAAEGGTGDKVKILTETKNAPPLEDYETLDGQAELPPYNVFQDDLAFSRLSEMSRLP